MALVWERLVGTYNFLFDECANPTTKKWTLSTHPLPLAVILVLYILFVKKLGPMWMKNRKPFELNTTLKIYNIFQVFISIYICYEGSHYIFTPPFNFTCHGVQEGEERVARGVWTYYTVKLIELLDTVFFVLRKSDRQITPLHLYHHTIMPIIAFIALTYFPGGQGILIGTLNSFVHVVMYSYYLITSFGPNFQKYVWWKKYVTMLQILQFVLLVAHSVHSLFYTCSYHGILKLLTILEGSIFLYLFGKFYYYNYMVKKPKNYKIESNGKSENGHAEANGSKNGNFNGKEINDNKVIEKSNYVNGKSKDS